MKKYLIILFMLVYGLPSTGASLYLHYCCGKLDGVSFSVQHKEGCKQSEPKKKSCCNNVAIDLKLDTDQHPLAAHLSIPPAAAMHVAILPAWLGAFPAANVLKNFWCTGPPLTTATLPLFIKHGVFRI